MNVQCLGHPTTEDETTALSSSQKNGNRKISVSNRDQTLIHPVVSSLQWQSDTAHVQYVFNTANSLAQVASAQCTLQTSLSLNGHPLLCMFLVMTRDDILFSEHHCASNELLTLFNLFIICMRQQNLHIFFCIKTGGSTLLWNNWNPLPHCTVYTRVYTFTATKMSDLSCCAYWSLSTVHSFGKTSFTVLVWILQSISTLEDCRSCIKYEIFITTLILSTVSLQC
jgi:hypothetical protein